MEVHHAAVTLDDLTAVLLNEKVTLSTNLTSGDKIKDSYPFRGRDGSPGTPALLNP
jgi:hypothetical protein